MKKFYKKPIVSCQRFEANEYIAACGDSGKVYNFKCNAGSGRNQYAVLDASGNALQTGGHKVDGSDWYYHPCGETHQAESDSGFLFGYHLDNIYTYGDENIPVVVWTDNGTDVHCTTDLDVNSWETAKS